MPSRCLTLDRLQPQASRRDPGRQHANKLTPAAPRRTVGAGHNLIFMDLMFMDHRVSSCCPWMMEPPPPGHDDGVGAQIHQ
jgi:hypothetical protein